MRHHLSFKLLATGWLTALLFFTSCQSETNTDNPASPPVRAVGMESADNWNSYWYNGQAELNSYDLEQARYGEIRKGEAVLMFVTENFDPQTHTKSGGQGASIPTIKVNFDKKFLTGIYPYSMLLTAVSPVNTDEHPHAITATGSVQEWCGHTFTQFNLESDHYAMTEHSYFPGEGDSQSKFDVVWLEDEVWTRLRISPEGLPTGEFQMVPGIFALRMEHGQAQPQRTTGELLDRDSDSRTYKLSFADGRTLSIDFSKDLPYHILGWQESGRSGLVTKASRKKTLRLDYWNRKSNADLKYRKELGLKQTGME